MRTGSHLTGTILGSWLMAAGVAHADDALTHTPTLYGTPETLAHLEPLRETFLDLAKMDTLVFSREALIRPEEEGEMLIMESLGIPLHDFIPKEKILERTRTFLKPFEHLLPYTLEGKTVELPAGEEFSTESLIEAVLNLRFTMVAYGAASSTSSINETTGKSFCEIIPPKTQQTSEQYFLQLAGLPHYYDVSSVQHITYANLSDFTYLHEAAHCGQERDLSSPLAKNLRTLAMETEADNKALNALKSHLLRREPEKYYNDIVSAMQDARAIGSLRNGSDVFSEDFATHSTYVYESSETPGFVYDASDVAAANKIINTATNVISGFSYASPMAKAGNLEILELLRRRDISIDSPLTYLGYILYDPHTTIEAGRLINQRHPAVHYGTVLAVRDFVADYVDRSKLLTQTDPQTKWVLKLLPLTLRMIDNYIDAVQRRVPALADDPIAHVAYEKIKTKFDELNKLALAKADADPSPRPVVEPTAQILTSRDFLEYIERHKPGSLPPDVEGVPPAPAPPGP